VNRSHILIAHASGSDLDVSGLNKIVPHSYLSIPIEHNFAHSYITATVV